MPSSRRDLVLACSLSALAGYVDGVGFLHLGGLFVSFMSGNSTQLGVSLAEENWANVKQAAMLIGLFVTGAACGSLIVRRGGAYCQCWVMLTETLLLLLAGIFCVAGLPNLAIVPVVTAMGLENAMFQANGGDGLGLTYVTGALVKVGEFIAAALTGGSRWAWLPNLLLWAALLTGVVCGARAYLAINLSAIWFAATVALVLTVIVFATAKPQD